MNADYAGDKALMERAAGGIGLHVNADKTEYI